MKKFDLRNSSVQRPAWIENSPVPVYAEDLEPEAPKEIVIATVHLLTDKQKCAAEILAKLEAYRKNYGFHSGVIRMTLSHGGSK